MSSLASSLPTIAQSQSLALPPITSSTIPAITELVASLNLPRTVIPDEPEISEAWSQLPGLLRQIPHHRLNELHARLCIAVASGLFDAAINYIWNSAIISLRQRVTQFGLSVVSEITSKAFDDGILTQLQDSELLELCLKLNLLDENAFFFLSQSREVRNSFSAAHPPPASLDRYELLNFMQRCIRYALIDTVTHTGVSPNDFVRAIKSARFNAQQEGAWVARLRGTNDAQRSLLVGMLHGVYCDPNVPEEARLNALQVCQPIANELSDRIKSELAARHQDYVAKGDQQRMVASQAFLEKCGLLGVLTNTELQSIFLQAIRALRSAHDGMNNFYTEPPFAARLHDLTRRHAVPTPIQPEFVETVILAGMGNPYGICWAARDAYHAMVRSFSPWEIELALRLPNTSRWVRDRLASNPCRNRFKDMLALIERESVPNSVLADYDLLRG